ncbi:MAG: CoB--CoM heterodisulfide reductase iron-sulfur subunit B family protein [Dehalococcoidales bacterium]|nr:CoB--CoM heterodisulfide reductase iron-sulfur subunit B family protein [Dehalococcoidales bacterium]
MNVSYYPGCSLDGTAREYRASTEAVARKLAVNLHELEDWNCCGASSAHATSDELATGLSARNLRTAERAGMDLVVPCAMCYQQLKQAEKKLLAGEPSGGATGYSGHNIRYLVDFFWEDVGEKAIGEKVTKPLSGLNVVCYYGCLSTRPPKVTDAGRPEDPQHMDKLMKALGATVKSWSFKTECCGGDLGFIRPEVAFKLSARLLDMAAEAGADAIVTGCPLCQANLDMRQPDISKMTGKKYAFPVFYFTELMGLAFGDPSVGKWLNGHMINPNLLLKQKGLLNG